MKFILLNGSSCSGKSTIIKEVMKKKDRYYWLSYDAQKWQFSQYDRNLHFSDVRSLLRAIAETVCTMQYNIICDSALYKENRNLLLDIPESHGYEVIEINLEADYEVLLERFHQRVKNFELDPSKRISNLSVERFKELFDIYNSEKNTDAITMRSDKETVDECVEKMLKLV